MNNKFKGIFKKELDDFVTYKKINGFSYESQTCNLISFDEFTLKNNIENKKLTKDLIIKYIESHKDITSRTKNTYASIFREFAKYLNTQGFNSYVLPEKYYNSRYNFHPYIYSKSEIKKIFGAVKISYLRFVPKKQEQIRIILLLLFKTGMRIGEVLTIKRSNINYDNNTIILENTKNGTDRLVAIDNKLTKILYDFEIKYNSKYEYYFENGNKKLYSVGCFNSIFRKHLYIAKIMHTKNGPRVHDIRHTFCVNSLKQAIDNGADLNYFIPLLSAYVGHLDLDSTYKYLHLTVELFPKIRDKAKDIIDTNKEIHYEEL